jgi:hypothetical protein
MSKNIKRIEPILPCLNLKKETIRCNTQSLFQNKLSEVLYEDTTSLGIAFKMFDESKEVIDIFKDYEKQFIEEV